MRLLSLLIALGAILLGATLGFADEASSPSVQEALTDDPRESIDTAILAAIAEDAPRLERRLGGPWLIGGAGEKYESPWDFEVGLAASLARGNTETLDVLFDGKVNYERNKVAAEVKIAYVYGEAADVTTAENWHAQARMERKLPSCSFLFGKYNFDQDRFADLDYRHTGLLGFGRTLIDREKTKLKLEVGGGMAWEQRVAMAPTANPSAYLGADFAHEWGEGNTFTLDYDFIPYVNNFDLSYMTWDAKFGTPLCKGLDLTVSIRVGWVFEPPEPTKAVDLLMAVGLRLKL